MFRNRKLQRLATCCNDVWRDSEDWVHTAILSNIQPAQKIVLGKRLTISPCDKRAIIKPPRLTVIRRRRLNDKHAPPAKTLQCLDVFTAASLTDKNQQAAQFNVTILSSSGSGGSGFRINIVVS